MPNRPSVRDEPDPQPEDRLSALGVETSAARRAKRVLPWIISPLMHGLIIALALAVTYTVTHIPKNEEAVLVVADFNALHYAPVVGTNAEKTEVTGEHTSPDVQPLPAEPEIQQMLGGTSSEPGIDVAAALGTGASAGAGSALSRFAPKYGQNSATFAGVTGSNARKIVYVIDASGSMITSFKFVTDELARSIGNLSPQQSFGVIFFQGNQAIEVPPEGRLKSATPEERSKAMKWIGANVVPQKGTNPLVAIEKALAFKPDVIFLLSQDITGYGQFEVDQKELMARLDKLNPRYSQTGRRSTQINCIQFLDSDPLNTMQTIAAEHGGPSGYKLLTRSDLGLGERQ